MDQDMEMFFTREKTNEGIDLPLVTPSGEETEHTLRIRGVDSDEFRLADAQSRRKILALADVPDKEERERVLEENKLQLIATLIVSWTFKQECTMENKIAFLKNAPQIADAIDRVASSRRLFFKKESKGSSQPQSTSFDSDKSQKGRNKR